MLTAGPLKQPIPEFIYCSKCESKLAGRGGYLMGGWSDWIAFPCPHCQKVWYWNPDKP